MEQILPEHYIFMGNTYFYGKIVSMFGKDLMNGKGSGKIMKYMMLSEMMKGNRAGTAGGMNGMLPFLLMGKDGDLFDGLFDIEETEDEEDS